jgi:hypothetical protein
LSYFISKHHTQCPGCQRHRYSRSILVHGDSGKTYGKHFSSQTYDSDDENERLYGNCETPDIELDWPYISNPENIDEIRQNIVNRKGVGDIDKVVCTCTSITYIPLLSEI